MGGLQPVAAKPTVLDAAMAAKMGLPPGSPMPPKPSDAQDKAIKLARDGHFDEALVILGDLHNKDKNNQYITRDYATVLSWAGHDQDAVDQYETLTTKPLPDYLLAAAGHSYRQLHETDKALATYREGLRTYPDNVVFAEGEIRCLMDAGAYDDALAAANNDLSLHGNRPEITAAPIWLSIRLALAKSPPSCAANRSR
jgi:tetratricopeptide (TPR) repeat protein